MTENKWGKGSVLTCTEILLATPRTPVNLKTIIMGTLEESPTPMLIENSRIIIRILQQKIEILGLTNISKVKQIEHNTKIF